MNDVQCSAQPLDTSGHEYAVALPGASAENAPIVLEDLFERCRDER